MNKQEPWFVRVSFAMWGVFIALTIWAAIGIPLHIASTLLIKTIFVLFIINAIIYSILCFMTTKNNNLCGTILSKQSKYNIIFIVGFAVIAVFLVVYFLFPQAYMSVPDKLVTQSNEYSVKLTGKQYNFDGDDYSLNDKGNIFNRDLTKVNLIQVAFPTDAKESSKYNSLAEAVQNQLYISIPQQEVSYVYSNEITEPQITYFHRENDYKVTVVRKNITATALSEIIQQYSIDNHSTSARMIRTV